MIISEHDRGVDRFREAGWLVAELAGTGLAGAVAQLAAGGWPRILCEGGPRLFADEAEDAGFTFPDADDDLVRASHALWQSEVAYAREVLERSDLDAVVDVHGEPTEVRDIVVHMIEEYARHCGHADLVRECIDGRAGQ